MFFGTDLGAGGGVSGSLEAGFFLGSLEVLNQIWERVVEGNLGISQRPDHFSYKKMAYSIPQYSVNHLNIIEKTLSSLKEEAP